ncbi:unnamed protein product, partial [Ectocarpus sp. 8 AP-2014]
MTNKVCEEQVIQHVDLGSRGLTKCRAGNTATTRPPTHPPTRFVGCYIQFGQGFIT